MAELVYRPVVGLAQTLFKAWDLKIDCRGSENIPRSEDRFSGIPT